jgi:hypothetical protein
LEIQILDMQRNPTNPVNVSIRTIPEVSEGGGMEEKRETSPMNTERSLQMNIQTNRQDVGMRELE